MKTTQLWPLCIVALLCLMACNEATAPITRPPRSGKNPEKQMAPSAPRLFPTLPIPDAPWGIR